MAKASALVMLILCVPSPDSPLPPDGTVHPIIPAPGSGCIGS